MLVCCLGKFYENLRILDKILLCGQISVTTKRLQITQATIVNLEILVDIFFHNNATRNVRNMKYEIQLELNLHWTQNLILISFQPDGVNLIFQTS